MASNDFFQNINYASFHEDSHSELRALQLKNTDRVLCLTGSGARPLDLLPAAPAEIVAIDWNPAQSMLLELKLEVIRRFTYEERLAFLGLLPSKNRTEMYAGLRPGLSVEARAFWDARKRAIQRGVYFEGRWERFLRTASSMLRTMRGTLIQQVLDAPSISAQQTLWRDRWDNTSWRLALWLLTSRFTVQCLLREPGLKYINRNVSPGAYLQDRFRSASREFLFSESPWVYALAHGRISADGPLPIHLQRKHFDILRERVDSIRVVTASLCDYLKQQKSDDNAPFQAFSLSDFSSYANEQEYGETWQALLPCAAKGARICERRFLVEYPLPPQVQKAVAIDHALSEQLGREDRSVVYTFLVACKKSFDAE